MMDDIVGDYKDKTVTLEDFPFFDASQSIKMASVHPCKHASVMKVLLDRADAAMKLRRERAARGEKKGGNMGMEGLTEQTQDMALDKERSGHRAGVAAAGGAGGDEWEVLQEGDGGAEEKSAIRVDQYLVVFLKVCQCPFCEKWTAKRYVVVHGKRHTGHRARLHDGCLKEQLRSKPGLRCNLYEPQDMNLIDRSAIWRQWNGMELDVKSNVPSLGIMTSYSYNRLLSKHTTKLLLEVCVY